MKQLRFLLPCLLLPACAPNHSTNYIANLNIAGTLQKDGMVSTPVMRGDVRMDVCFKNERQEDLCMRNVGNGQRIRIDMESTRLALSSITLLGEKPYGDKNYYYAFLPEQYRWIIQAEPKQNVYIGTLLVQIDTVAGSDAYPGLGVASTCNSAHLDALKDKFVYVTPNCLQIGSIDIVSGNALLQVMPPAAMYRPFGRDPDVPFGVPSDH